MKPAHVSDAEFMSVSLYVANTEKYRININARITLVL